MQPRGGLGRRTAFNRVTLIVLITVIAATAYFLWRLREEAINRQFDAAAMYAIDLENQLTQSLNVIDLTMTIAGDEGRAPATLAAALRHAPYLRSLNRVGTEGSIITSSDPRNVGVRIVRSDFLPPTPEPRAILRVGPPWIGRDFHDGRPTTPGQPAAPQAIDFIPVLRDIPISNGRWATLLASVNTDYFLNYYGRRIAAGAGVVELLRYDGTLLLSTDERQRPGTRNSGDGVASRIAHEDSGRFEQRLSDGRAVLTAYRASQTYPFILVVSLDKNRGLAGWRQEAVSTAVIVSALLLASLALGKLYFARMEQTASQRERKELEAIALIRRNQVLMQNALDGIHILDDRGNLIEANDSFCRILGYTQTEARQLNVFDWEVQMTAEEVRTSIANTLDGQAVFETVNRRKDRTLVDVEVSAVGVELDGRKCLYVSSRDITARRQAEAELRLRGAALEAAANAIFISNRRGDIKWANSAFCALTGYSLDEVLGRNPRDFLKSGKQAKERYDDLWGTILAGQVWRGELINRRKDGTHYHEYQTITPVPDENGSIRHFIAVKQDITERKQGEERMKELSRHLVVVQENTRRRLSGELHDRTSPNLAAIGINLNIIATTLPEEQFPTITERLEDIRALIDDATASIREICADLRPAVLDYAGLPAALEGYARQFAKRTGIEVQIDCVHRGARLAPDLESMLFRIVQEALTNCAKHSRASSITVALRLEDMPIVLTVADDGIGFDPDLLGKTTHKSGLGILTMREMAEFFGGKFTLESRPGQGTRIHVEI